MISRHFTRTTLPTLSKECVACDPQRAAFYRFEREFFGSYVGAAMSRRSLQELANHACRYYRVEEVTIRVRVDSRKHAPAGESTTWYCPETGKIFSQYIELNRAKHGANACTLMHELAHYIADHIYENIADHGKQFAGIYMHLLDRYHIFPSVAFRPLAKRHGIRIAGKFRPAAIRG